MFMITTAWRAKNWPGTKEEIDAAGLVFFKTSPTEILVHKDTLFGNAGKTMADCDGNILSQKYCQRTNGPPIPCNAGRWH